MIGDTLVYLAEHYRAGELSVWVIGDGGVEEVYA